jgi:hypothetical protein
MFLAVNSHAAQALVSETHVCRTFSLFHHVSFDPLFLSHSDNDGVTPSRSRTAISEPLVGTLVAPCRHQGVTLNEIMDRVRHSRTPTDSAMFKVYLTRCTQNGRPRRPALKGCDQTIQSPSFCKTNMVEDGIYFSSDTCNIGVRRLT